MSHQVRLQWRTGREAVVTTAEDETVLASAERQGVVLPYGCRTGACATCTGRVLAGEMTHIRPARALKPRQRRDGYVLLCIAVPQTDCTVEVGAAVSRDLVSNPWK